VFCLLIELLFFAQTKAEKDELLSAIKGMKEDAEMLNSKFTQQQQDDQQNAQVIEEYQSQMDKLQAELEAEKNK